MAIFSVHLINSTRFLYFPIALQVINTSFDIEMPKEYLSHEYVIII